MIASYPAAFRLLVLFLTGTLMVSAEEVQRHGFVFEAWVRDTFFDGYRPPSYTQKWDIPADVNRAHGGVPVNPKAASSLSIACIRCSSVRRSSARVLIEP